MGFNYFIGAEAARDELLVLDPRIRDWVLLPLVAVMFLVAIFRHYVTKLLRSERKPDMRAIRDGYLMHFHHNLQTNSSTLQKITNEWK